MLRGDDAGEHATRQRLLLLAVSVTSVALVVMLVGIGVFSAFSSKRALVERSNAEAQLVAQNAASALAFQDAEFASRVLKTLRVVPEIAKACLYDADGEVFATYIEPVQGEGSRTDCPRPAMARAFFRGEYLEAFHDVDYRGEIVGSLYLMSRTTALSGLMMQYVLAALVAAVVAMAAALLLTARMQRRISEPLEALIDAADRVRRERDYGARAIKYRDDELGHLTDTFNAMLAQIERASQELEHSQQKYRDLFNTPLVAMLSVDATTGQAREGNIAAAKLLGYDSVAELKREFVVERHIEGLGPGGALREELLTRHQLFSVGVDFVDKSGSMHSADFSGRWIAEANVFQVALADTTERRATERHLRALERQVRQQQKLESIGTLASGVAHEINNPIQAIMGQAELLGMEPGIGKQVQSTVHVILEQAERISRIVSSLLTFARKEPESRSPESAQAIVHETLRLMSTIFRKEDIPITVELPEEPMVVMCNRQQIQQVLMNLMTNARDALNARYEKPGPDKRMAIRVGAVEFEGNPWVRFTVEDHGTGIPIELRERIFDPFFTTKRTRGTGLGLSIGHGIVRDHGGRLTVDSQVGQYTRFYLDLPLHLMSGHGQASLNHDGGGEVATRGAVRAGRG